MTTTESSTYTCRFCRLPSDASGASCPNCGAPVDITTVVSKSGWQEQPAVKDMARIQFGRSTCQIEGTFVPTADFGLSGDDWIYFSHHHVLWVEPTVQMTTLPMAGGWNRVRAGLPLVMLQARGPGHIALSDDSPGEVIAIPIQHGGAVWVREHRFLAATGNVNYSWQQSGVWITTGSGDDQETHYPLGMFVDIFHAQGGPGLLLLHSPGNMFIRDLAAGGDDLHPALGSRLQGPQCGDATAPRVPQCRDHELAPRLQLPPGMATSMGTRPRRSAIGVRTAGEQRTDHQPLAGDPDGLVADPPARSE